MKITPLPLAGACELHFPPIADARGHFMRWYDRSIFAAHGLPTDWVQANESHSVANVVRGLHFQRQPHAETKFVRVSAGAVYDVIVDLRPQSSTFGRWHAVELSTKKNNALLVPKGFAHGFCVLTPEATVSYLVDNVYAPEAEGGVIWNDPDLGIPWPLREQPIVSEKDRLLPRMRDLRLT